MSATQRRSQLIHVAKEVFAEVGYEATTIEEIAHRADVSKPVVYQHFGGKEGIYAVVVDREVNALLTRITANLDGVGRPRAMVHASALAFLDYLDEDPAGFKVLVRDTPASLNQGELGGLLDDVADKAAQALALFLAQSGRDPALAPLFAQALVGCIAQVGTWWDTNRTFTKAQVANYLTTMVFTGLANIPVELTAH
ncbi:TetR/AcrR family transcriptional regulator [Stomatohabitans albus]|uniref:TetR/AcrR family transcriptional regulator n=1 Tax=Stomatohabitans albus TaxID=3110766 RepID=UPI00300D52C2